MNHSHWKSLLGVQGEGANVESCSSAIVEEKSDIARCRGMGRAMARKRWGAGEQGPEGSDEGRGGRGGKGLCPVGHGLAESAVKAPTCHPCLCDRQKRVRHNDGTQGKEKGKGLTPAGSHSRRGSQKTIMVEPSTAALPSAAAPRSAGYGSPVSLMSSSVSMAASRLSSASEAQSPWMTFASHACSCVSS